LLVSRWGIDAPLRGIEIGVFKADTCARLLKYMPRLHMTLIDPWRAGISTNDEPGPPRSIPALAAN
jgi:hypothetical protein